MGMAVLWLGTDNPNASSASRPCRICVLQPASIQISRHGITLAAVAEKMSGSAFSQFSQPAGKGLGFYTGEDGYLYCDNLRVDDIRQQVKPAGSSRAYQQLISSKAVTCAAAAWSQASLQAV